MYARVIQYHARPEVSRTEATSMYHQIISVLERMDGYLGSTFLMNDATHRAVSITWWRDDACAADAGRTSLPMLMRISNLMVGPPEISGFDVVDQSLVQLVPPPTQPGDALVADAHGSD